MPWVKNKKGFWVEEPDHICGNCSYIEYRGINVVNQRVGNCKRYKLSDRLAVRPDQDGCSQWQKRQQAKLSRDEFNALSVGRSAKLRPLRVKTNESDLSAPAETTVKNLVELSTV